MAGAPTPGPQQQRGAMPLRKMGFRAHVFLTIRPSAANFKVLTIAHEIT